MTGAESSILASRKYRHMAPSLVARVSASSPDEKAARSKLHAVALAYQDVRPDYDRWLTLLRRATDRKATCAEVMRHHASSRERLPYLDSLYRAALPEPPWSVIDVGCGLNPLAIPWMNLPKGATYRAYDVMADLVAFLNEVFPLLDVDGRAELCDALSPSECGFDRAEVALALKLIPCLEQLDSAAGARLLDAIPADHLVVSFPLRSLGGARKGMGRTYEARMEELLAGRGLSVERYELPNELLFVLRR